MAGAAARGSTGTSRAFEFELEDGVGLPRLLELGPFFGFPDVEAEDFPVVAVVEDRRVVDVVEYGGVLGVDELDDADVEYPGAVVVVEDDAAVAWAWVTWMLRWPSLESEL